MKLVVLGSGSAGNCIVFGSPEDGFWMVDAGLSSKQICVRLEAVGVPLESIRGIFITHEHKDHIGGLKVLLKKLPVPVYASELTHEYLVSQLHLEADWAIFEPGQKFFVGDLEVDAVRVPHDATDPCCFIFKKGDLKMGVVTDLGYASESLLNRLKGVEILYLESNYDVTLLEMDQKRPWSIKQRISSRHGHLSNIQALEVIKELQKSGLTKVAFGHLSGDCNSSQCIEMQMANLEPRVEYEISSQKEPTAWLDGTPVVPLKPENWVQPGLF